MAFFAFFIGIAKDLVKIVDLDLKFTGIHGYYEIPEDSSEHLRWLGVLSIFSQFP